MDLAAPELGDGGGVVAVVAVVSVLGVEEVSAGVSDGDGVVGVGVGVDVGSGGPSDRM